MCLMVYLSAEQPLKLVDLNEADPTMHVSRLMPDDEVVQRQFRSKNAACVGAFEGCSCGFQYGEYPADAFDAAELALGRRSLDELANYLRAEIVRVGDIEVFACWDGDQAIEPKHRRRLSPSVLERSDFFFLQRELSVFVSDADAR